MFKKELISILHETLFNNNNNNHHHNNNNNNNY